jgi:hypothetical protein
VIVRPTTRIEIPPSAEIIDPFGFRNCIALREVTCRSDCHLKNICRFDGCISCHRITILSSVEIIDGRDFLRCTALSGVVFRSNFGIAISLSEFVFENSFLIDAIDHKLIHNVLNSSNIEIPGNVETVDWQRSPRIGRTAEVTRTALSEAGWESRK